MDDVFPTTPTTRATPGSPAAAARRATVPRAEAAQGARRALPRYAESNATRYMSAAAYLDQSFATTVIEEVLHQPYRAVAPSYGFDIGTVVRHCLAAQRLIVGRNLGVLAVLVLALILDFGGTLSFVIIAFLLRTTWLVLATYIGKVPFPMVRKLIMGWVAVSFVIALYQLGLFDPISWFLWLVGGAQGGLGLVLDDMRSYLSTYAGPLLLLGGIWVVMFINHLVVHRTILDNFAPENYRPQEAPPVPPRHQRRVDYLLEAQTGNTTVYGRGVSAFPFIGSGGFNDIDALTVPLVPADDGDGVSGTRDGQPVTVHDFYDGMRDALVDLADPNRDEATRIPGMSLQDRVFVSGVMPLDHPLVDRHRGSPRYRVLPEDVRLLSEQERGRATHYLAVRIAAWEGELEITVFLFFSIRGNMLYVELVATVLPPIKDQYHAIDTFEILTPAVMGRAARDALANSLSAGVLGPWTLVSMTVRTLRKSFELQGQGRTIQERLAFDYGATLSIRELAAEWEREEFFQFSDGERYIAIVKRRVVDAIAAVLGDFGYDADEFARRAEVVIDQSTNFNNSPVNNSAFAVGKDSTASVHGPRSPSRSRRKLPPSSGGAGERS